MMQTQLTHEVPANRAQRRAARKTRKLQTRARQPRPLIANAMELVTLRATRLTADERGRVMEPAHAGLKAMREGVATADHWGMLSELVSVAKAIEAQGIVRGIHEHLAAAEGALDAVWHRVQAGVRGSAWARCTTLYFNEIEALDTALFLHDHQLQQLAVSEYHAALAKTKRDPRAGTPAAPASYPAPLPTQEQLL